MNEIFTRRSIRRYTTQKVEQDKIIKLLEAAMQAPSANNQQPWEFIVVDDKKLLEELSSTSTGAWMLNEAPLAIVPLLKEGGKSPHFRTQDMAAAVQNILLETITLNLGAVWIGVYPKTERVTHVKNTLNIPSNLEPFCIISIGYPNEQKDPITRFEASRIHKNKMV